MSEILQENTKRRIAALVERSLEQLCEHSNNQAFASRGMSFLHNRIGWIRILEQVQKSIQVEYGLDVPYFGDDIENFTTWLMEQTMFLDIILLVTNNIADSTLIPDINICLAAAGYQLSNGKIISVGHSEVDCPADNPFISGKDLHLFVEAQRNYSEAKALHAQGEFGKAIQTSVKAIESTLKIIIKQTGDPSFEEKTMVHLLNWVKNNVRYIASCDVIGCVLELIQSLGNLRNKTEAHGHSTPIFVGSEVAWLCIVNSGSCIKFLIQVAQI